MAFVYNKASGLNDARFGKIETPIRMIIEHESDLMKEKKGPLDWLFNVETSNRFGEAIMGGNEFDVFRATAEGGRAENDAPQDTFKKFIEHIQFMKSFTITAEMMEDAISGVPADGKLRAQNFTRAYYKTRHKIATHVLAEAAEKKASTTFAGSKEISLTGPDDRPLFSTNHKVGIEGDTQSNIFSGSGIFTDASAFSDALAEAAVNFRNMKDENGDPLGYTPDTIILPGNNASVEKLVKEVIGTEQASGNGSYINTQYGNWSLVILPNWLVEEGDANKIMLMSNEANEALRGNMFFNRIPLTIDSGKDPYSSNYFWVGRCRFGIGFGSYKHIMLLEETAS